MKSKSKALSILPLIFAGLFLLLQPSKNPTHASPVQSSTQADQSASNTSYIDGQKNPELIKDVDAYRLFLLAAATNGSSQAEFNRQRAMFHFATTDGQFAQVHQILTNFEASFNGLVASFNQSAAAATDAGTSPNLPAFMASRDALVLQTVAQLGQVFPVDSQSGFYLEIQREKRNMRVALGDSAN